jgi:hypothetical protein
VRAQRHLALAYEERFRRFCGSRDEKFKHRLPREAYAACKASGSIETGNGRIKRVEGWKNLNKFGDDKQAFDAFGRVS